MVKALSLFHFNKSIVMDTIPVKWWETLLFSLLKEYPDWGVGIPFYYYSHIWQKYTDDEIQRN